MRAGAKAAVRGLDHAPKSEQIAEPAEKSARPKSHLKYYAAEVARHPWPHSVGVNGDRARVERAATYLARVFHTAIGIEWAGESISYAYPDEYRITLARQCSWLIFAHEVAHLVETRRHGSSRHGRRLALIVDEVCAHLDRYGWIERSLDAQACAVVA